MAFGFFEGVRRYHLPAVWANPSQTTADVPAVSQAKGLFVPSVDIFGGAVLCFVFVRETRALVCRHSGLRYEESGKTGKNLAIQNTSSTYEYTHSRL